MLHKLFWFSIFVLVVLFLASCAPKPETLPKTRLYSDSHEAKRILYTEGYKVFPVTGTGSMEPLIPKHPAGKHIIVGYAGIDKTKFEDLRAGQIVIYKTQGKETAIHRLGQKSHKGWFVHGIANHEEDSIFVIQSNFVGKVRIINLIFWK